MDLFSDTMVYWVLLPLLIFLARVVDVAIGTIRFMHIGRGIKFIVKRSIPAP